MRIVSLFSPAINLTTVHCVMSQLSSCCSTGWLCHLLGFPLLAVLSGPLLNLLLHRAGLCVALYPYVWSGEKVLQQLCTSLLLCRLLGHLYIWLVNTIDIKTGTIMFYIQWSSVDINYMILANKNSKKKKTKQTKKKNTTKTMHSHIKRAIKIHKLA